VISTTDILTLDALEVAKRAQLPLLDVRRLANHVIALLQGQLGLKNENASNFENVGEGQNGYGSLRKTGKDVTSQWSMISTLDPALDAALAGGIPTGYITEIAGERYGLSFSHPTRMLTFPQRRRQNAVPPHAPAQCSTSRTPWPFPPNALHFDGTSPPDHARLTTSHNPPHSHVSPYPAISEPHPHSKYSRPRIPRPHPDLPTPRRARPPQCRARNPRQHSSQLSRRAQLRKHTLSISNAISAAGEAWSSAKRVV